MNLPFPYHVGHEGDVDLRVLPPHERADPGAAAGDVVADQLPQARLAALAAAAVVRGGGGGGTGQGGGQGEGGQ